MASDAETSHAAREQTLLGLFGRFYEHRGTYFEPLLVPEDRLLAVPGYDDVRTDDVFVWTYPKAGTHWICDIASKILLSGNSSDQLPSCQHDVALEIGPPKSVTQQLTEKGVVNHFASGTLQEISDLPSPRVIFTHLLFDLLPQKVQDGIAKVIYVYRDPRDMAVSMWHQRSTFRSHLKLPAEPWHVFLANFNEGRVCWGLWSRHFKSCQTVMDKPHILVLYYEQILQDLKSTVQRISLFLGKELSEDATNAIVESTNFSAAKRAKPDSVYIRKGVAGDWKNTFTVAQAEEFNARISKEASELQLSIPYGPI